MNRTHTNGLQQYLRKLVSDPAMLGLTDRELLERFSEQRDEIAFTTLVRRHGLMVLGLCQRVLQSGHDAEDVCQATFLVLASKAASSFWQPSVGSWLYRVAYQLARKAKAAAVRRALHEKRAIQRPIPDPLDTLTGRELLAVLDDELTRLPEKYRAPLVLCYLEGATRDQAARQLGCPLGTLKHRLEQGRTLLRRRLAHRGLLLSPIFAALGGTEEAVGAAMPVHLAQPIVQMALRSTLGNGAPATLSASGAAALARGALKTMYLSKLKIGLAVVLAVCVAGAGAGVIWQQVSSAKPAEALGPEPKRWADEEPGGRFELPAARPGFDRYGDPLPPHALTRLGSNRFWCGSNFPTEVAYTPDGRGIAATSSCGAFVFEATTGKLLRHINTWGSRRNGNYISVSPAGKHLALAANGWDDGAGDAIQIWDVTTGQLVRECQNTGRQHYLNVRYSPDGKMLAANSGLSSSRTLFLWDAATGKEIRRWQFVEGFWGCFTFSPDSKTLIAGDVGMIHFWDAATGKEVRRIGGHPGWCVYRLALTQDGKTLATQVLSAEPEVGQAYQPGNTIYLWDAETGKELRPIKPDLAGIEYFQFSPDTKTLVTACDDRVLRIWDVATGKELRRWELSGAVCGFAFSPDGKELASLGSHDTVHVWDVATGKELRRHPGHRHGIDALALSRDGRTLASASWVAAAGYDRDVHVWDTATGQERYRLTVGNGVVNALNFSVNGRTLTTLGEDGKAHVWDIATGKELGRFGTPRGQPGRPLVLSPDGTTWASGSGLDLILWDAATGKKRQVFTGGQPSAIGALGFSSDGATLYSWSFGATEGIVQVWDVGTGKKLREFAAARARTGNHMGSFSPDGKWFAFGGNGPVLLLYDMATGTVVHRVEVPALRYGNRSFAISPDSRILALGDEEGTIYLLEFASGKFRRRWIGGHHGNISALLFSADGKRLVSGSSDTTAFVWDLTAGRNLQRLPLRASDLDPCWSGLASEDAERAYESILCLAASPAQSVPYLGKRLHPVHAADGKHLADLISDLDSNQFAVRDKAARELEKLEESAIPACRKALAARPHLELRRRLEAFLEKLTQEWRDPSPCHLQTLRALEVLELAGSPEARRELERLAGGVAEARITQEARSSLERLAEQAVPSP